MRHVELYAMDLLWALVQPKYGSAIPLPSEIWENKNKIDRRSAKEIIEDTYRKFGGE